MIRPLILTPAERRRIRASWQAMIPPRASVWDVPGFKASLLSLVEQGYVLQDIACMFGVSRERVRQWLQRIGIRAIDRRLGTRRAWDDSRHRFIPVTTAMLKRRHMRPCACGCGEPVTWAPTSTRGWAHFKCGHWQKIFDMPLTKAGRRAISQKTRARWAAMDARERATVARRMSCGHARRKRLGLKYGDGPQPRKTAA